MNSTINGLKTIPSHEGVRGWINKINENGKQILLHGKACPVAIQIERDLYRWFLRGFALLFDLGDVAR